MWKGVLQWLVLLIMAHAAYAIHLHNMGDGKTIQIADGIADGDDIYSPIDGRGGGTNVLYWYSLGAIVPDLSPDPYPFKLIQDPAPSRENEAQLVAVVPPGFDAIHEYIVDLVLEDTTNEDPPFTCTLTLQVTRYLYVDAPYNVTLGEHATVSQTIANITATDADGQTNNIIFTIIDSNPKDAPFLIGPVTADQDTSVAELQNVNLHGFDYETGTNVYELFIRVSDISGNPVRTATVTVYILDELERMIITNLPDSITISESVLGSVFIVEWDPPSESIWMLSTSPVNGPFSINATGSVNVVSPGLNYEEQNSYDVTIFLGDEEGFTDNKVLHVTLLPNLGPEITNLNDTIQISEMSAGGTDIFVVQAVDNEGDDFYCVMFANPNDGNFGFTSSTNSIYVINSPILDFETVDEYTLSVTCHDLGVTNTKPGTPKVLTVQVTDENEAPIITNLPATVKVPEDALNSVSIFQADGYDVDGNSLSFSLTIVLPVSGQGKFAVADSNGNDGTVSISNNPGFDFEDVQQYSLVLEATDGEFTATGTLTVDIMDVAEPPVFANDNQDVYIDEEQIVGTLISLDWAVTDVDDVLTDLTYNIIAGTYSPYFSLTDGTNPELRIAQVMDYEASFPVPFPIMFTVTDPAGKKDYLTVNVYLQNIYDNAPIFTQAVYSADLFDGESQGSPVLQALATDVDLFDIITYSIEPDNTYFVIDSQLGEVTVNEHINSSISGNIINFTLVATDLGSNRDTAFVQVTVASVDKIHVIIDSNERPYWNWEVPYDLTNDTYVNNVVTNNQIFEKSGSIIYKLYMPNTRFRMTTDGQVFVAGKLMAEEEYILMYYVEDDSVPPIKAGVSMIRIDTYIPQMVLVDIHLGISVADFTSSRQTAFISALNKRYKPWKYRISSIRSDTAVATRKLLQNTAIVEVYALKNDFTNSQDNVDKTKEFVYFVDLAEAMQIDSDGTPGVLLTGTDFDDFPVESVQPTYELINTHNSYSWWLNTAEGNATIAILILLVIIVIVSICCCCWFVIRKQARSDKQEITSRADVNKSGENNLNNSSIVHMLEDKKLIEKDGIITDQSELQKNVGDSIDEKDADSNGIRKDLVDVPAVEKAGDTKLIEKDKLSSDQSKLKNGVGDNLDEKNVDKNGIKKDSNDASVAKKAGVTKQTKKLKDKDNLSSDQSKLKNGVGDNLDVKNVDKNGIKKDSNDASVTNKAGDTKQNKKLIDKNNVSSDQPKLKSVTGDNLDGKDTDKNTTRKDPNKSSVVHKAGDTNLNEKKKLSSDQSKLKQSSGVKDDTRASESTSKKDSTSLSQMKNTNQKTGKDVTVEQNKSLATEKNNILVNTLSAPESNDRKDSVIGPLPDMSKKNKTQPKTLTKGLSTRSLVSNKNLTSRGSPTITNLDDTVQIGELSPGGSVVKVVEATDDDGDAYYCIMSASPNDGNFIINTGSNTIYVSDPHTLDFETLTEYKLTVTCHDNINAGTPRVLTVQITNENEAPQIPSLPATASVLEDAVNSVSIFEVSGYDVDGNALSYSLVVTPSSGQGKFFVINSNTYDATVSISSNPSFDFEDVDQYSLVLEATDGALTATGTLNVDIVDIAEPPIFVNDNQDIYLDEEQSVLTQVPVDWTVTDVDDVLTDLTYNMIAGTYSPYFSLTGGTNPQLRIAQVMDYEASFPVPFPLMFSVTDPRGETDFLVVNIFLQDVNDNTPTFSQAVYPASVYDGARHGVSVLHVLAVDEDELDNITYSIEPENAYFDIDSFYGEVTLKQTINATIIGWTTQFTVVAMDTNSQQDTATVVINFFNTDLTSEIIPFPFAVGQTYYNWEVAYNAEDGTSVNNVMIDNDYQGNTDSIIFKLYLSHPQFQMSTSGHVFITNKLDSEKKYLLTCYAEDDSVPPAGSDVSMIRIDTYIPQLVVVDLYLGISVDEFTTVKQTEFIETLDDIYNPWKFRISAIHGDIQVSSRKLLQSTATVEVYALTNDLTDSQDNVDMIKEFVYFEELTAAMRKDTDGTPMAIITGSEFDNFPIVKVEPATELITTYNIGNWWLETVAGNVTIAFLSLLGLLLFLLIGFCCWRFFIAKKCRRDKKEVIEQKDTKHCVIEMPAVEDKPLPQMHDREAHIMTKDKNKTDMSEESSTKPALFRESNIAVHKQPVTTIQYTKSVPKENENTSHTTKTTLSFAIPDTKSKSSVVSPKQPSNLPNSNSTTKSTSVSTPSKNSPSQMTDKTTLTFRVDDPKSQSATKDTATQPSTLLNRSTDTTTSTSASTPSKNSPTQMTGKTTLTFRVDDPKPQSAKDTAAQPPIPIILTNDDTDSIGSFHSDDDETKTPTNKRKKKRHSIRRSSASKDQLKLLQLGEAKPKKRHSIRRASVAKGQIQSLQVNDGQGKPKKRHSIRKASVFKEQIQLLNVPNPDDPSADSKQAKPQKRHSIRKASVLKDQIKLLKVPESDNPSANSKQGKPKKRHSIRKASVFKEQIQLLNVPNPDDPSADSKQGKPKKRHSIRRASVAKGHAQSAQAKGLNFGGLNTPVVVTVTETIADDEVVYTNIDATGQGGAAQYFYVLESITPDPGAMSPFLFVQGPIGASNTAEIRAVVPPGFDFETEPEYVLEVTVVDQNDIAVAAVTGTLTVQVANAVEPPRFVNFVNVGSIGELVTESETFMMVTATDDDSPLTVITFNIIGTDPFGAPFQIGPVVYDVATSNAVADIQNAPFPGFDFETGPTSYELYIEAADNNGGSTTSTLTVAIVDENEPISITNLPSTIYVPESMLGNVFLVEWADIDIVPAGTPTFMVSSTPANGPFSIDTLGNVKVVIPGLNFLERNYWSVTVYVEDPDGLSDSKVLSVWVTDVNTGPDITNLDDTIQIGEKSSGGSAIFDVQAVDDDEDDYFCVMFANPNDGNFKMNSTTNTIYVADSPTLDFENLDEYALTVTCHDNINAGTPKVLTVEITDENEAPTIINLPATVTVPEDAINSVPIFEADVFDVDGSSLRYFLTVTPSSGQGKFFVINSTDNDAKIKISNNPAFDFEDVQQYSLVLEATDGEFTATGTLNVDIVDTEEPPKFVNDNQDVHIDEEQVVGTLVTIDFDVIDVDDVLTDLVFNMIGGTYSPYFSLTGGTNPELRIAQVMDFEASFPIPFSLMFTVTDPSGEKDYLTVNIYLENINDNAPVFTQLLYSGEVFEMDPYGTFVLQVSATDADSTDIVTYSIFPVNAYFEIDTVTGEIIVSALINLEVVGETIVFAVVAKDTGSPEQEVTATVQITVLDINDNVPSFAKAYWNWEVRYDIDVGSYVNSVTATDPDLGDNGLITYMLYVSHPRYEMEVDGQVIITSSLNAEQRYILICYAEDSGTPPAKSDVSMIRIDTYIPQLVLVDVYLGITVDDFTTERQGEFIDTLSFIYSPWTFRLSTVRHDLYVSTRKLLQNTAVVEIYALANDLTDYQDNVDMLKEFVYFENLAAAMRIDSDGTPTDIITGSEFDNFPIVKVEPTYQDIDTFNYNWWLDTVEGNVTLALLTIVLFIIIIGLLVFCCWRWCWKKMLNLCKQSQCNCKGKHCCWDSTRKKSSIKMERPEAPVAWEIRKPPENIPMDSKPNSNADFDFRSTSQTPNTSDTQWF
uniref:Uncharacterized protein LOC102809566 n=1 Tax=Saccoglossus kowalevskii TaxID=10224 RepID=A0ABM0MBP5_SACKO|nr:PREDICTED: uncharacterized protein LOC102809566 [Saccoglossus kowalevskii]